MLQPTSTATNAVVHPKTDAERKAWKASQDFEAIFVRQLFQSMRKATQVLESAEPMDQSGQMMQDMAWDRMADQMVQGGGFGLARQLYPHLLQDPDGLRKLQQTPHNMPKMPAISQDDVALGVDSDVSLRVAKARKAYSESNTYAGVMPKGQLDQLVQDAARATGVDSALLRGVIQTESAGNPKARSPVGAMGLMQLMPGTAKELGVDPKDPRQNVMGGARYLAGLLNRFDGNEQLALAGYNAGPGAVEKHGGIPPYRETQDYVQRVLAARERFAKGGVQ